MKTRKHKRTIRGRLPGWRVAPAVLLPALALFAVFSGCRAQLWSGFPPGGNIVWPGPPETPRVAYVMEIREQKDLFSTAGFWRSLGEWVAGAEDTRIGKPFALALHPAGGLLVTDPGRRRVVFFDWARRKTVIMGDAPFDKGGLDSPVGVAVLADGRIIVSDSRRGAVESFDADGRYLGAFVPKGAVGRPAGIAVDPARGEVYVADVTGHSVAVFNAKGELLRRIGRHGSNPGEFNFPTHLARNAAGLLAVTDSMNFRVQIFSPDGAFVRQVGSLGNAPGRFSKPKGVALDPSGRVMCVEGLYDGIGFFDPEGRLLLHLGNSGSGPGEFWLPAGLAFDEKERLLFVADSYNARVQVFRLFEEATP